MASEYTCSLKQCRITNPIGKFNQLHTQRAWFKIPAGKQMINIYNLYLIQNNLILVFLPYRLIREDLNNRKVTIVNLFSSKLIIKLV